jgi:hypothetical protein
MLTAEPQRYAIAIRRKNSRHVLCELAQKGAFLEIGPGNGEMLTVAKEAAFPSIDIAGIDASVVERIREWHPEVRAHYVEIGTPLSAVLGTEKYVSIVACHVLEHISQDQRLAVLKNCHAMLVPGGAVVLELPNPLCPLGGWANYLANPTHQLPMFSTSLGKLMSLAGFTQIDVGPVRPVMSARRLLGIVRWVLSVGIVVLANALGRTADVRSPTYYAIASRK